MSMRVLAIVPAYNEELNVPTVIRELNDCDPKVDIVVVNDGSSDKTQEVASAENVPVLSLPFNLGIGGAVQTGFRYAWLKGYDVAIQVDGDGQHLACEIKKLLPPIESDQADVVIGSRFIGDSDYKASLSRRIGIWCFTVVNTLILRQRMTDNTSGFRAYNRKAIKLLSRYYPRDYPEPEAIVILKKHRFRLAEVPVKMRERQYGDSSIGFLRAIYYMIKVNLAIFIDLLKENERVNLE